MRHRPVLVLLIAVATLAGDAPRASAGTYQVHACNAAAGVNRSWTAQNNHGGVVISQSCPAFGADSGLVTRAAIQPPDWTVPTGSMARWAFSAPPGAAVVSVDATGNISAYGRRWQVGFTNGGPTVFFGCAADALRSLPCAWNLAGGVPIRTPPNPVIYAETRCVYGPCSTEATPAAPGGVRARMVLHGVTVTVQDSSRPSVARAGDQLWTGEWLGGRRWVRFDAADNVGIREVRALIDGRIMRAAGRDCDPAAVRCPDWPGARLDLPTYEGVADGTHTLTLQAVDRAGNVGQVARTVRIDNTPPAAPEGVAVAGGDGWRSSNAFAVGWRNPQQQSAPIAAALYTLCPHGRTSGCLSGTRTGTGVHELTGVKVPARGSWDLRVWLRDAAGNTRVETAAAPVPLRFDDAPPTVAILPMNPDEPAKVHVRASDSTSGVARGEIEIRRVGAPAWRVMTAQPETGGFSAVVDDERLADGAYELRARAFDAAGNERSTQFLSTGRAATLHMPVRVKTRLRVGQPRKVRARRARGGRRRTRTIYITRPRIAVGRPVRVGGRLVAPGGNPLQGATVEVSARPHAAGTMFQPVASLTTSRTGRFTYLVPAGPSRTVRFRYPGTPTVRAQTSDVTVLVRAGSTIRASRRRVVNGEPVTFAGRLRGGWVPAAGKLVEVQFFARGRWRTFATTRADTNGRWRYEYRFDGTRGTVRWRFRARIPLEVAYPFTAGTSRPVAVTVHGL
jgi:hypothetical protein